jgi:septal ring factor EnvC (AmiA/AmiB activator)
MTKAWLLVLVVAASALMGGCLIVNEHHEPPPPAPAATPTPPPEDPRSIGQLQRENQELRTKLAKAEKDHEAWKNAVENQKRQLKAAERERDRVKDERDLYKKRAKHDNND